MFTRPPLYPIVAAFSFVTLVAALSVTPIFVSHDEPPGEAARFWWARLAPRSYAPYALRSVRIFFVPERKDFCTSPESPLQAWQTIATHPQAEAIFAHLFAGARPSTRLYALAGLARVNSRLLSIAVARARADTSRVLMWTDTRLKSTPERVGGLVSEQAARAWAAALTAPGIPCAA